MLRWRAINTELLRCAELCEWVIIRSSANLLTKNCHDSNFSTVCWLFSRYKQMCYALNHLSCCASLCSFSEWGCSKLKQVYQLTPIGRPPNRPSRCTQCCTPRTCYQQSAIVVGSRTCHARLPSDRSRQVLSTPDHPLPLFISHSPMVCCAVTKC